MTPPQPLDPQQLAAALARALQGRAALEDSHATEPQGPPTPPPGSSEPLAFDEPATRRHIELLSTVLQALSLRGRALARDNAASVDAARPTPESDAERRLGDAAVRVHALLVEHPLATRALIAALAAEGRRFAATREGERLRAALLGSRLVRRGALLWNSLTMGLVDDGEPSALPSAYLDVLVELSERADLERILGGLATGGAT